MRIPRLAIAAILGAVLLVPGNGTADPTRRPVTGDVFVHRAGGPASPSKAMSPRLYGVGHAAMEPTLGLTKNGDVFYTSFESSTRVNVLRSRNGGKTWDVVSPSIEGQNAHLVSVDPYLTVDPDTDRIFTIDLTVACSFLSFSETHGDTWTTNPIACGRPVNDHQTLFTGPPVTSSTLGYPNVVYYCFSDFANSACSKSLDGGITFTPTGDVAYPAAVDGEGTGCPGWHGHGVVDEDGTVYLPKGHCAGAWLAISRNEGMTWTRVRVAKEAVNRGGSDPAVALDEHGNLFYVWIGKDRLPYLAVSRDKGKSWTKPIPVAPRSVKEANLVTISAGADGRIAIAYTGSENSLFQQCGGPDGCAGQNITPVTPTWHAYMAISTNGRSQRPLFYTARLTKLDDPLIEGGCGPGRCPPMIDFIDVQIDAEGQPWASFVDGYIPPGGKGEEDEGLVGTIANGPSLR